jgi:hypothetical protein
MDNMKKEQELIDLCFQIALTISDKRYRETFDKMSMEERAEWVRKQLSECGFKTHPCGSSWGVLDNEIEIKKGVDTQALLIKVEEELKPVLDARYNAYKVTQKDLDTRLD